MIVNFEVASSSSFQDNREKHLRTRKMAAAPVELALFVADRKQPMTSFLDKMSRLFGTTVLRICELVASAVFHKIEISHLCNDLTTLRPFGPHVRGQEAKMTNDLHSSK